jgi:hypothetical protein
MACRFLAITARRRPFGGKSLGSRRKLRSEGRILVFAFSLRRWRRCFFVQTSRMLWQIDLHPTHRVDWMGISEAIAAPAIEL